MEYWIVYDAASGEVLYRGGGDPGSYKYQSIPEGAAVVAVPQKVVAQPEIDLDAFRAACLYSIDTEAEMVRARYRTPGEGQTAAYAEKEREARAWIADASAETPFLSVEAAMRGIALGDLAAMVIARADAWKVAGPQIEGRRMAAKDAVGAAGTFGAIVKARNIDWDF